MLGSVVVGLVVGSFVTTAALRSVRGEQGLVGRSRCDGCGAGLGWGATTPVLSYALRAGACSRCGGRIDPLHPIGEVAGGLIAAFSILSAGAPPEALLTATLGFLLLGVSVIDARSRRLPDGLTALVAATCLVLSALEGRLSSALAAAAATFLLLEGLRRGFLLLRRKPGLGFGDVKLLTALALWLGVATPWAVAGAALVGLVAFAVIRPADGRLAFGPAIAVAGFLLGLLIEAGVWRVWGLA